MTDADFLKGLSCFCVFQEEFYTGTAADDDEVRQAVQDFLKVVR